MQNVFADISGESISKLATGWLRLFDCLSDVGMCCCLPVALKKPSSPLFCCVHFHSVEKIPEKLRADR